MAKEMRESREEDKKKREQERQLQRDGELELIMARSNVEQLKSERTKEILQMEKERLSMQLEMAKLAQSMTKLVIQPQREEPAATNMAAKLKGATNDTATTATTIELAEAELIRLQDEIDAGKEEEASIESTDSNNMAWSPTRTNAGGRRKRIKTPEKLSSLQRANNDGGRGAGGRGGRSLEISHSNSIFSVKDIIIVNFWGNFVPFLVGVRGIKDPPSFTKRSVIMWDSLKSFFATLLSSSSASSSDSESSASSSVSTKISSVSFFGLFLFWLPLFSILSCNLRLLADVIEVEVAADATASSRAVAATISFVVVVVLVVKPRLFAFCCESCSFFPIVVFITPLFNCLEALLFGEEPFPFLPLLSLFLLSLIVKILVTDPADSVALLLELV
jgi:hypothetical protein